jgi:hypothetical protein
VFSKHEREICQVQWFMPIIPATWKVDIGKITVQGQPGHKKQDPISTNKLSIVVHFCNPSFTGGIDRRISVQGLA